MGVFRDPKKSLSSSIPTPRPKEDPGRDFFPLQALETLPKMIITRCTNDFLWSQNDPKWENNKPGEVTTILYIYINSFCVYIHVKYMYVSIYVYVYNICSTLRKANDICFFLRNTQQEVVKSEDFPATHLPQTKLCQAWPKAFLRALMALEFGCQRM